MHRKNGSSLSMGRKLHWKVQSQIFLPFLALYYGIFYLMQIALMIVSFSLIADYISAEKLILTRIENIDDLYYIVILVTGVMCLLLLFSIGFLLIGQTTLILQNLTTLESFYDEIFQNVYFIISRIHLKNNLLKIT